MSDSEISEVVQDIETRLKERENGQQFRTDREHVYYSPAKILYVPVFAADPSPGGEQRIMDTFAAVEREAEARFHVDVLVLPAETWNGHNGTDSDHGGSNG